MIILDNRKGSKELLKYFPPNMAQLDILDYADAMFIGNGPNKYTTIAIERKAISDLIDSINTGRLVGYQLPGLLATYNYIWLIVEGIWRTSPVDGLIQMYTRKGWQDYKFDNRLHKTSTIIKYLLTLTVQGNIRLWFAQNPQETVHFIVSLYRWWNDKEFEDHTALLQEHGPIIQFRKPTLMKRIAKELEGIGIKKASKVVKQFKTPLEMCLADEKEWMKIPGIGKKLASNIVKSLQQGGK